MKATNRIDRRGLGAILVKARARHLEYSGRTRRVVEGAVIDVVAFYWFPYAKVIEVRAEDEQLHLKPDRSPPVSLIDGGATPCPWDWVPLLIRAR